MSIRFMPVLLCSFLFGASNATAADFSFSTQVDLDKISPLVSAFSVNCWVRSAGGAMIGIDDGQSKYPIPATRSVHRVVMTSFDAVPNADRALAANYSCKLYLCPA